MKNKSQQNIKIYFSPNRICRDKDGKFEKVYLLIVIKSLTGSFARRKAVRSTWGNTDFIPGKIDLSLERLERMPNSDISPGINVRRIFLLGDSTPINDDNPQAKILSKRHEALLIEEQREYGDILQGEFHDSFRNLTLKEIMFLNWLPRHCPRTQFIFKVKFFNFKENYILIYI